MACDVRIAANYARVGQTEINNGIIRVPVVRPVTHLGGLGKAKELVMAGRMISAEEVCRINLVNVAVEDEKLMEEALNMARVMTQHSPVVLGLAK